MAPTRPRKFPLGWLYSFSSTLKAFLKIAHSAGDHHSAACKFGAGFMNLQTEFLSELFNLVNISRICAVGTFELGARHGFEAGFFEGASQLFKLCLRFGTESDGNLDGLVRMRIVDQARAADGMTFTT